MLYRLLGQGGVGAGDNNCDDKQTFEHGSRVSADDSVFDLSAC